MQFWHKAELQTMPHTMFNNLDDLNNLKDLNSLNNLNVNNLLQLQITSKILSIHLSLSTKSKVLWTAKIFAKLQN